MFEYLLDRFWTVSGPIFSQKNGKYTMDKKPQWPSSFFTEVVNRALDMITDSSGKHGKPANAHKHEKYGYQQFKDKMVTQVLVNPNRGGSRGRQISRATEVKIAYLIKTKFDSSYL